MYDPDVIAYLFPHEGKGFDGADLAITMARKKARLSSAGNSVAHKPRDIPSRQDRGGTEPPVEGENINALALRFSCGARTKVGLVVGHAATADLTVQKNPGISTFHLAFTFDDQYRLIVRDLGSRGPRILKGKPPILNITDLVQFKVVVPHRDNKSPGYINKVEQFRLGTKDPGDLFASFIIHNAPVTQLPTGQHTPLGTHANPSYYKEHVGSGSFGYVEYVWDVTTGDEYVVKRPIETSSVSFKSWKKEAEIMKDVSHPHIVMFREATFYPWPELKFEYVPGGSLDSCYDLSTIQNTQITCQLSSALEYLHNKTVSIAHRDIKPANILVVERGKNDIYVKFADFGFSKQGDALKSCLGTPLYAAPELHLKAADRKGTANDFYGVAVDIWSLGTVVASLECGLPEYDEEWGNDPVGWIRGILKHVEKYFQIHHCELIRLLLDNMLVENPDERSPADCCHDEAQKLLRRLTVNPLYQESDDDDNGPTTPEASRLVAQSAVEPKSAGSEASTIRPGTESAYWDSSQTPTGEATVRKSVESFPIANLGYHDGSQIHSLMNSTGSEEWQQSGAQEPEDQLDQALAMSAATLPQEGILGELLRRSEPKSLTSNHDVEAREPNTAEAQVHDQPKAKGDRSFLKAGAKNRHQTTYKRGWPVDRSPTSRPACSFTDPSADNSNRDSKEPSGSPSHKRSRRGDERTWNR
ncbi:hypothetical protein MMC07_003542 [Pseudocyphellaria aurata]|nr:hypothetical protein [Pseudocyphellaria aurata]